jgi:hypothetical protein
MHVLYRRAEAGGRVGERFSYTAMGPAGTASNSLGICLGAAFVSNRY